MKFLLLLSTGALLLLSGPRSVEASAGDDRPSEVEAQKDGDLELPAWEVGESREGFDIRIWPEEVVMWLEQENLRDLIADPDLPEEERKALRQVLAQQQAWKSPAHGDS